ncbi:MAG: hypothetical protein NWQ29_00725 [Alphaproteobacteria bacterium]|jgi:hypothetical protein|nr:hypothetical protein [Alphaproteobacteria bacterium]
MKKLILLLTTVFVTHSGFCMDPFEVLEANQVGEFFTLQERNPDLTVEMFLQNEEQRLHANAAAEAANIAYLEGAYNEVQRDGGAQRLHQEVRVRDNDPFTVFAGNEQVIMEYYAFLDRNPGVTPEGFLMHEQQRIADNAAALAADAALFELQALQERIQNIHIVERREYVEGYITNHVDYRTIQEQRALFAPILAAFTAVNPTNAQDLDVHIYDAFYGAHNSAVLNILRALRLGQNRDGNIYTAEQARDRAVTILQENGQADSINSVAAQLPGYFAGLSADDTELFCRLVGIVHDFVEHENPNFVHYLLGIPENWATQGGCVEGRRNRNLVSIIPLLRTLGLGE